MWQLLLGEFVNCQEQSSCLSSLLLNRPDPSITTRLRFTNKFLHLLSRRKKISDIYVPCSVSLPNSISIKPSILVFWPCFISPSSVWLCISIHCIVYCCLCVYLVLCCFVLWPQNWINWTNTGTVTTVPDILMIFGLNTVIIFCISSGGDVYGGFELWCLFGGKRGDYQNCSVLYSVLKPCTVISTLRWAVLNSSLDWFCQTGLILLCIDSFICVYLRVFCVLLFHTA